MKLEGFEPPTFGSGIQRAAIAPYLLPKLHFDISLLVETQILSYCVEIILTRKVISAGSTVIVYVPATDETRV